MLPSRGIPFSVAIVDDHMLLRVGVAAAFHRTTSMNLTATGASVSEALGHGQHIDVLLLDLRLADGSRPRENIAHLQEKSIDVVCYTSGESPPLIREAARAGAMGMLRKTEPMHVLLAATLAACHGEVAASIDWAAALDSDPTLLDARLSPRERDVLERYASGEGASDVAKALFISRETVLEHVQRIRRKYADVGRPARTKIHLYQRAIEDGVLSVD
ncbi:response regulator transcription factor [Pseudoclavibacter sp. AY1F1]|uniref:LuxR C-terminal-related transcriptional regulator n=1 Tax=Pseudoclavibacter sp. AY1F1 TaxID=2080583 RepID=UPI0015E3A9BE|nr:response regulator transcription factor [Pseudoclavibacter sp. AY1F1]